MQVGIDKGWQYLLPESGAPASWLQVDFSDHGRMGFNNGHAGPVEATAKNIDATVSVAGYGYGLDSEIN